VLHSKVFMACNDVDDIANGYRKKLWKLHEITVLTIIWKFYVENVINEFPNRHQQCNKFESGNFVSQWEIFKKFFEFQNIIKIILIKILHFLPHKILTYFSNLNPLFHNHPSTFIAGWTVDCEKGKSIKFGW
jgi:hypothetical protein